MNVILCNDDGIDCNGLKHFAKRLVDEGYKVLVVAPDGNRSGASHSISFFKNFKVRKVENFCDKCTAFAISGTPVDCVKFAMLNYPEFNADLIIAGINKGHNLGSDVLYSGTVAIASEGAFFGKIGFAFSAFNLEQEDFSLFAERSVNIIKKLLPKSNSGDVWNVNFPDIKTCGEIKGEMITPLGKQIYSNRYIDMGNNEYQLVGERLIHEENNEDCDVKWVEKGYVSITPILYNKTNFDKINEVKDYE